ENQDITAAVNTSSGMINDVNIPGIEKSHDENTSNTDIQVNLIDDSSTAHVPLEQKVDSEDDLFSQMLTSSITTTNPKTNGTNFTSDKIVVQSPYEPKNIHLQTHGTTHSTVLPRHQYAYPLL